MNNFLPAYERIQFHIRGRCSGENDLHHHPRVLTSLVCLPHKFLQLSLQFDANGCETDNLCYLGIYWWGWKWHRHISQFVCFICVPLEGDPGEDWGQCWKGRGSSSGLPYEIWGKWPGRGKSGDLCLRFCPHDLTPEKREKMDGDGVNGGDGQSKQNIHNWAFG